jgi:hypothetical protein
MHHNPIFPLHIFRLVISISNKSGGIFPARTTAVILEHVIFYMQQSITLLTNIMRFLKLAAARSMSRTDVF